MRKAFSLFTAIVVLVLMAGVATLVMNISGKVVKETTAQYRKEQAVLLAKSYTEFAILAIQGRNMKTNGCLRTITGIVNSTVLNQANPNGADIGEGYRVTVRMRRYIGLPADLNCTVNTLTTSGDASVLIDVNVRYKDPDATDISTAPWINYNRRTLQKL